jgi:hypothetical protein
MKSQVKLTPSLQIGFSGHRTLSHELLCGTAIRKILAEWKTRLPGGISGLSSLAAGGDLLFAEACFELGIPLRVLLPLPKTQFKEDFDAATWIRAEDALNRAAFGEVVGAGAERPECYYECGLETIHQCGLLIVLWNGLPARGHGGTGEMAQQSRNLGYPVIWVHSETGEVTYWNKSDSFLEDLELTSLNDLPDGTVQMGNTPKEQALAWFHKLNENANQVGPQFRKIIAVPILCAAIGAVLTTAAYSFKSITSLLLGASAIAGLVASFAPKFLKAKQKQESWAKTRAAAEISRSFVALWDTPDRYSVIDRSEVPELGGMLDALNNLKMFSRCPTDANALSAFKAYYQKERIEDQASYFAYQSERATRIMSRALKVIRWSVIIAIGGNIFVISCKVFHLLPPGRWMSWMALGIVVAFQVAAGTGAMIVINDYARRQQRYTETRQLILNYGKQLEPAQTWTSVLRVVNRVEKTLLTEVIEWRALFKNQKLGK